MKLALIFVLIFLNLVYVNALTVINEVMFNPTGDDNNKEFIEVYSDDYKDLSNFIIQDSKSEDKLKLIYAYDSNYSLIVEDGFDYSNIKANIYAVGATIGNNLNNDGDVVILKDNNSSILDSISYSESWAKEGNSICKLPDKDGFWRECVATPGEDNSIINIFYDFSNININEFMADPIENDDSDLPEGEWVELYNKGNTRIDVSSLVLYDEFDDNELYITDTNTLNGTFIEPNGFLVVYRNGDSDFNLNNDKDKIRLYDGYPLKEHKLIDEISYSNNAEGLSQSRVNNNFIKTIATPQEENNIQEVECDFQVEILLDELIFDDENDFEFKVKVKKNYGSKTNFSLEKLIEDINGDKIKDYKKFEDEITEQYTSNKFTPNIKEDVFLVKANIDVDCDDNNLDNNFDEKLVSINKKESNLNEDASNIKILNVLDLGKDKKAKFGQVIRVRTNIYKGDETKTSVNLYLDDDKGNRIGKITTTNIDNKFSNNTITLPLQIDPNCDNKLKNGNYDLVLEGFDLIDKYKLEIQGNNEDLCKEVKVELGEDSVFTQDFLEKDLNSITGNVVYSSKQVEASKNAMYLFVVVLILFIIHLLRK